MWIRNFRSVRLPLQLPVFVCMRKLFLNFSVVMSCYTLRYFGILAVLLTRDCFQLSLVIRVLIYIHNHEP